MTVCIGMICEQGESIVAATDSQLGLGGIKADHGIQKWDFFWGNWMAVFAGHDVSPAWTILQSARETLDADGADTSPLGVANAVQKAMTGHLRQKIETTVLGPLGYTLTTFQTDGRAQLGDTAFRELLAQIKNVSLDDLEFLLCGFNDIGEAELWRVDGLTVPQCFNPPGFWAIGSGAAAAMASIAFDVEYLQIAPIFEPKHHAAYSVMAAKFMAESAEGVGRETSLFVLHPNGIDGLEHIHEGDLQRLRVVWGTEGAPRMSMKAVKLIGKFLPPTPKPSEGRRSRKRSKVKKYAN